MHNKGGCPTIEFNCLWDRPVYFKLYYENRKRAPLKLLFKIRGIPLHMCLNLCYYVNSK